MEEENTNNPYEIPITDINSESNSPIGQSGAADIISATGNLNPNNFWMVVMIILMLGFGGGTVFWITNLYSEITTLDSRIAKKDVRIEQLEKDLAECPQKTLDRLKETQRTIQELRGEFKSTKQEVEIRNKELYETNNKLKKVEEIL